MGAGRWVALGVLALMAAGCSHPATVGPASTLAPLPPLPPPRSNNPQNLIGTAAVQDPAYAKATTGPLPWRNECIRQWTSGAYLYSDPPIVAGLPCRFLPTKAGTIHVATAPVPGRYGTQWFSASVPRRDGGWDWVYLDEGRTLWYLENGTTTPRKLMADVPVRLGTQQDQAISAVRLTDNSIHVGVHGEATSSDTPAGRLVSNSLVHVWWRGNETAESEVLPGGYWLNVPALRADGNIVAGLAPFSTQLVASTLYYSIGAGFRALPIPGRLMDVWLSGGHVYGCTGTEAGYFLVDLDVGETAAAPLLEFIAPGALGIYCQGTMSHGQPVVGYPSSITPIGATTVATRTTAGWVKSTIKGDGEYGGQDMTTSEGVPYFVEETGSGTTSTDPKNGTVVWRQSTADPTSSWEPVWGSFSQTDYFVQDLDHAKVLIIGQSWDNPPFDYAYKDDQKTAQLLWGLIELPATATPPAPPS